MLVNHVFENGIKYNKSKLIYIELYRVNHFKLNFIYSIIMFKFKSNITTFFLITNITSLNVAANATMRMLDIQEAELKSEVKLEI